MEQRASAPSGLRLAELMAALSLATDLGMGQPLEQALRTCLIALRLGTLAKLPADELPAVYYGALLRFLGCTADRHETARVTGDDIAFRRALAPVLGARHNDEPVAFCDHRFNFVRQIGTDLEDAVEDLAVLLYPPFPHPRDFGSGCRHRQAPSNHQGCAR